MVGLFYGAPPQSSTLSKQELITLIKSEVVGQDAVAHAVTAKFVRRHASRPADRLVDVILLVRPNNKKDHLSIAGSLINAPPAEAKAYDLSSDWGQDPELLFRAGP
ncbi:hypothetical protein [Microvirga sp. VF16]|uniref:hypothetical protein n=1 Tax=Microvirga sp. VF16 TaxID=2807101 RepID=UPI00193DBF1A|nr:hypothetical protein [Microvirga sp. VF16]QRM33485.1 hypothetical protein JO965_36190 [Microvirga sp. VF16]